MADARFQRIRELFAAASELREAERGAFLDRECRGDTELRAEVVSLLSVVGRDLPTGAGLHAAADVARRVDLGASTIVGAMTEAPSQRIGPYKLLERIGEGGFGVVYSAEQEAPLRRKVALKIIKLGMDTKQVIARFEAERQALAMMDHANIARVFDAGATESGRPYFVMELVRGVPITEYCDANNLTARERLELFLPVCQAVQHAHHKGVIHRDLKPGNILVTLHDGKPVPKVIDFGIAKATEARLTEKTLFTEHRQMVGTPAYMSPEQAEMSGLDVDTRTDVYSLGVLLYELLTGTTPFHTEDLMRAGYGELQRIIREVEPQKPSTRVSTLGASLTAIAGQRKTDGVKLGLLLRGDLDWIVMRCLEKDRTRRYDTPVALAEDVRRHLGGDAVVAAPPSVGYRVRKFVRRNRGVVVGISCVVAALGLGTVGTAVGMWNAKSAKTALAEQLVEVSEALSAVNTAAEESANSGGPGIVEQGANAFPWIRDVERDSDGKVVRFSVDPPSSKVQMVKEQAVWYIKYAAHISTALKAANTRLKTEVERAQRAAYRANITSAQFAIGASDGLRARESLNACPEALRGWEWGHLNARLDDATIVLRVQTNGPVAASLSSDATRVVSFGDEDQIATVWDLATGEKITEIRCEAQGFEWARFSPDSRTIETLTRQYGSELPPGPDGIKPRSSVTSVVQFWDAATGRERRRIALPGEQVIDVRLSPDRRQALCLSEYSDRSALLALDDPDSAIWLAHANPSRGAFGGFSPDGTLIWTNEGYGLVQLWDAKTGVPRYQVKSDHGANRLTFSPDSTSILSVDEKGVATLRHAATGDVRFKTPAAGRSNSRNHDGDNAIFSPDGMLFAIKAEGGRDVRVYDAISGTEKLRVDLPQFLHRMAFTPDGTRLATDDGETTRIHEISTGRLLTAMPGNSLAGVNIGSEGRSFSSSGEHLLTSSSDGCVRVWDTSVYPAQSDFPDNTWVWTWWSDDRSSSPRAVVALEDDDLRLVGTLSGREEVKFVGVRTRAYRPIVSPDRNRLAADDGGVVRVWDTRSGSLIHSRDFISPEARQSNLDYGVSIGLSPDGDRVFVTSWTEWNRARDTVVWDLLTDTVTSPFGDLGKGVGKFTLAPSGGRAIFGALGGGSTLVDTVSGAVVATLNPFWEHSAILGPGVFSPDGALIAGCIDPQSADKNRTRRIQFWLASDGSAMYDTPLALDIPTIRAMRFSWDGTLVAAVTWATDDGAGRVLLIDAKTGRLIWSARNAGTSMSDVDFFPDSSRVITNRYGGDAGIDIWDAADGERLLWLPSYRLTGWSMWSLDYRSVSADGRFLLVQIGDSPLACVLRSTPRRNIGGGLPARP